MWQGQTGSTAHSDPVSAWLSPVLTLEPGQLVDAPRVGPQSRHRAPLAADGEFGGVGTLVPRHEFVCSMAPVCVRRRAVVRCRAVVRRAEGAQVD